MDIQLLFRQALKIKWQHEIQTHYRYLMEIYKIDREHAFVVQGVVAD